MPCTGDAQHPAELTEEVIGDAHIALAAVEAVEQHATTAAGR
ncbi:hypothetical protein [Micromonospora sp. NBC_00617]